MRGSVAVEESRVTSSTRLITRWPGDGTGYVWRGVSSLGMKKQASDQSFHDRRHQERKRAEAAKKAPVKKAGEQKTEESSK